MTTLDTVSIRRHINLMPEDQPQPSSLAIPGRHPRDEGCSSGLETVDRQDVDDSNFRLATRMAVWPPLAAFRA